MSQVRFNIETNSTYDDRLSDFAKYTLQDRYLLDNENFQQMFARVASAYADNQAHAQRLYQYMAQHWFMAATPILSNGGAGRGLPISCFLNDVSDDLDGIVDTWNENVWLASRGGGIGTYWGNVRSLGEKCRGGKTSGIIPFIRVQDSLTLAISQGSLRRGSAAVYLPVWHPEIEEFLGIRKPTGGDPNRKSLNIHNAVCIDDKFMLAVKMDLDYDLLSPKSHEVISKVNARSIWQKILTSRVETGEPYILFTDTVNRLRPKVYEMNNLKVTQSNLCSEIMLATGKDHLGEHRTAVCCLSSLNLDYWEDWKDNELFIEDIMRFLDNVLQDFIENAPADKFKKAIYSAMRERSVGLGVMGFHSFLQKRMIPIEGAMAKVWNKKIFEHIRSKADAASQTLAKEKGACPDAAMHNINERFSHKLAIAPTASISIITGASPGIEPWNTNAFLQKTLSGSFLVKNKALEKLLEQKGENSQEVWSKILRNGGSVAELNCLDDFEKDVFKTWEEINQMWLIEHAADRTPHIDQGQSTNIFLPPDVSKKVLHEIHWRAWELGVKSLYYLRSDSIQKAEKISKKIKAEEIDIKNPNDDQECLACQ